jgi:chromate reductase, NAD(P)H dehydrogenase (quinone)
MSNDATILGLSGSARKDSFNTALLRAAATRMPDGFRLHVETIAGVPVYDGDSETEDGIPEAARVLKEAAMEADGLLLCSPEYNHGIPGAFKNAIDWMSRPPKDIARVFRGKPVALLGATPGMGGTRLAQTAWLPVFRALGLRPWFGAQFYLPRAGDALADGELKDSDADDRLRRFLADFCEFVGSTAS